LIDKGKIETGLTAFLSLLVQGGSCRLRLNPLGSWAILNKSSGGCHAELEVGRKERRYSHRGGLLLVCRSLGCHDLLISLFVNPKPISEKLAAAQLRLRVSVPPHEEMNR